MPVFCINSQEYTVTVITVCMQFNPEGALWQLLPSYPLNTKKHSFIGLSELTVAHSLYEILESLSQFSGLQTQRKENE